MKKTILFIAILLAIALFTACSTEEVKPQPKLVEVELIDDYGTHFKGWLDKSKFIPRRQIFDANGRINTGGDPCVAPGCGQNQGKQVCCPGTGSCYYC